MSIVTKSRKYKLKIVEFLETKETVKVIGTVYKKNGIIGDFNWMIGSGEYEDALFIFNDDEKSHKWKKAGRGNAVIRKYNIHALPDRPRSVGIVTGTYRTGYSELTDEVKERIDECFEEAKQILIKHKYTKLYYSAKTENGQLGTSLFQVNSVVIQYITDKIHSLSSL
jgi:hypothetical protein